MAAGAGWLGMGLPGLGSRLKGGGVYHRNPARWKSAVEPREDAHRTSGLGIRGFAPPSPLSWSPRNPSDPGTALDASSRLEWSRPVTTRRRKSPSDVAR